MGNVRLTKFRRPLVLIVVVGLMLVIAAATVSALTLQGSRWLEVDRLSGQVSLIPYQGNRRPARLGDRLSNVGDILVTGDKSSARLAVDLQTGFVTMAENTQVQASVASPNRSLFSLRRLSLRRWREQGRRQVARRQTGRSLTERSRRPPSAQNSLYKIRFAVHDTANAMTCDQQRCLAAGMNDDLSKPIKRQALDRALRGCPAMEG